MDHVKVIAFVALTSSLFYTSSCDRFGRSRRPEVALCRPPADSVSIEQSNSISRVPPSLVFPPAGFSGGKGRYPLALANSHATTSFDGNPVQITELRGWLRGGKTIGQAFEQSKDTALAVDPGCQNNDDPESDWHYNLEIDPVWAESQGIDLNQLFTVGSVMTFGVDFENTNSFYRLAALPLIHVELNGWKPEKHHGDAPQPAAGASESDWINSPGDCQSFWAYPPRRPLCWKPSLREGQYVRIVGSLLTDDPHIGDASQAPVWAGAIPTNSVTGTPSQQTDVKRAWGDNYWMEGHPGPFVPPYCDEGFMFHGVCQPGHWHEGAWPFLPGGWISGMKSDGPDHPARWTEMHPPDIIVVLDDPSRSDFQHQRTETVRVVAIVAENGQARGGIVGGIEEMDFVIKPPAGARPSANAVAAFREFVGPETDDSTVVLKEVTDLGDSVRVHVKVQGRNGGGKRGKFKAVYRVFWRN